MLLRLEHGVTFSREKDKFLGHQSKKEVTNIKNLKKKANRKNHKKRKQAVKSKKRGKGLISPAILFYVVLKPLIYMASLWLQNNSIW